jgi:hypothetical protein
MLPPLSEVTARPSELNSNHGKMQYMTSSQHNNAERQSFLSSNSRPQAGELCKLEKCKSSETSISRPARYSTPEHLKTKRQQPHHNPYMEPNVNIVTQNIHGTQGLKEPQCNIIDLPDAK